MEKKLSDIFNNTKFITVSTVRENGEPWATPIGWFAFDGKNIVFDNRAGTIHADNLARDGRCFVTIVNYDEEHPCAIYIATHAKKLLGDDYERAKQAIIDRGLSVDDDVFAAPVGVIDEDKSNFSERSDGSLRFYAYMKCDEGEE